jgi:hypothetical protein
MDHVNLPSIGFPIPKMLEISASAVDAAAASVVSA